MNICAGILAGGQSSRFGRDKAFALLHGKPLIVHLIESVRVQVDTLLLSVQTITPAYQQLGVPLVLDQHGAGPLAGVAALLQHCTHDWLLLLPCDAVAIAADESRRMLELAKSHGARLVVRHDGERAHPTFALIHRELAASVQTALRHGERALYRWQASIADRIWYTTATETPRNINTQADLTALELTQDAQSRGSAAPATDNNP